ncbi:MAG: cyclic nucleotide-binding domain-containing protein, partial [Myxococcota bacterium]
MSAEYTELLQKVALFQSVEGEELSRIASLLTPRDVPKDAHVVTQDEPGDALYIIAKGRMKVVLYGDNGREVILTLLKGGDFFGEMALLDDLPRSAN